MSTSEREFFYVCFDLHREDEISLTRATEDYEVISRGFSIVIKLDDLNRMAAEWESDDDCEVAA